MFEQWEEMWRFATTRFVVKWEVTPSYYVDISWDETGEVQDKLASGLWSSFDSRVVVELDGRVIGEDYLGGSIYENPSEFRDHIGMNARGHGSYFSDMVREAIKEARKTLADAPHVRAA